MCVRIRRRGRPRKASTRPPSAGCSRWCSTTANMPTRRRGRPGPRAGHWRRRADPFSRFDGGFELRCERLCQRIVCFTSSPRWVPNRWRCARCSSATRKPRT
ncbi:SpvB/TcaC N-terminal domain-containing protein [Burkholderia pseudomallei]|uniref:SpvB/TcaC N-terminal domain-containing protein n=1 Tax=Burkholderia pseudomallei TaxID=28450 RepID=UPI002D1FB511|nr:SpvB/TcaC N-terminal domain-containing protein [Burkholderia pseudomallei]